MDMIADILHTVKQRIGVNGTAPHPTLPPELEIRPGNIITLHTLDLTWHPMVRTAVKAARDWQRIRWQQKQQNTPAYSSLVLTAAPVMQADGRPDINRTGYGCGKTHIALACLWASHYVTDGVPVAPDGRFFLAADLIQRLDGDTQPHNEIGDAPVVVLDDVGAEGVLQYVKQDDRSQANERQARYFQVVDYCYRTGISVIITGNLTLPDLAAHIGGRAWSRLLEMAPTGQMVDLTGTPDYRRRAGGR